MLLPRVASAGLTRTARSVAPARPLGARSVSWQRVVVARATEKSTDEISGGLDPYLEVAVPKDQRPVNQLAELKQDPLYSWCVGGHVAWRQRDSPQALRLWRLQF